jgi:hypothetical protein
MKLKVGMFVQCLVVSCWEDIDFPDIFLVLKVKTVEAANDEKNEWLVGGQKSNVFLLALKNGKVFKFEYFNHLLKIEEFCILEIN